MQVVENESDCVTIKLDGWTLRIMPTPDGYLELMTSNGAMSSMSVVPQSGNVIRIKPCA